MNDVLLISYEAAHAMLDRIEAECGCELEPLSDTGVVARAQRVLDCDDPPKGEDRDWCYRVLGGNVIAG